MKTDQPQEPAPIFAQRVSVALGRLKKRLQRYYQKAYPDSGEIIHRMIDEEEAKARELSFFPHLILSTLWTNVWGNSACGQPKRARTPPAFRTISLRPKCRRPLSLYVDS
jgi:hypothetical protein